jgi:hypothetical protein
MLGKVKYGSAHESIGEVELHRYRVGDRFIGKHLLLILQDEFSLPGQKKNARYFRGSCDIMPAVGKPKHEDVECLLGVRPPQPNRHQ